MVLASQLAVLFFAAAALVVGLLNLRRGSAELGFQQLFFCVLVVVLTVWFWR